MISVFGLEARSSYLSEVRDRPISRDLPLKGTSPSEADHILGNMRMLFWSLRSQSSVDPSLRVRLMTRDGRRALTSLVATINGSRLSPSSDRGIRGIPPGLVNCNILACINAVYSYIDMYGLVLRFSGTTYSSVMTNSVSSGAIGLTSLGRDLG